MSVGATPAQHGHGVASQQRCHCPRAACTTPRLRSETSAQEADPPFTQGLPLPPCLWPLPTTQPHRGAPSLVCPGLLGFWALSPLCDGGVTCPLARARGWGATPRSLLKPSPWWSAGRRCCQSLPVGGPSGERWTEASITRWREGVPGQPCFELGVILLGLREPTFPWLCRGGHGQGRVSAADQRPVPAF